MHTLEDILQSLGAEKPFQGEQCEGWYTTDGVKALERLILLSDWLDSMNALNLRGEELRKTLDKVPAIMDALDEIGCTGLSGGALEEQCDAITATLM